MTRAENGNWKIETRKTPLLVKEGTQGWSRIPLLAKEGTKGWFRTPLLVKEGTKGVSPPC